MLQDPMEMIIVVGACTWIFVAVRRIRQGRDLGRPLRWSTWLPLILAALVIVHRVYKARELLQLLQAGGAINDRQRQLFLEERVHEVATVAALGVVLTGILCAIGRFGTQRIRRPQ